MLTADNALWGHTDEATALVVDDYPYGFRLRTQIRYWMETSPKHGDRFVSQTLNPKTGRWNKPKKSTYTSVGVMMLNEVGHVTYTGVGHYDSEENLQEFLTVVKDHLSEDQRKQMAFLLGARRAMKNVTVTVSEGSMTDEEKAEQELVKKAIWRDAVGHAHVALKEGEV